jgi:hypothetical protein
MAANATAAGELERVKENSDDSPIQTLEPWLCRAPNSLSKTDHRSGWLSIGQLINLLFLKNL